MMHYVPEKKRVQEDGLDEMPPRPSRSPFRPNRPSIMASLAASVLLVIALWFNIPLVASEWAESGLLWPRSLTVEERALKILSENPLIDGHNDLLILIRGGYQNKIYNATFRDKLENGGLENQVDLPRIDKGKYGGAFWAAFVPCPTGNDTDFSDARYYNLIRATLDQLDLFQRLGQSYPRYFTPARDGADALRAFEQGRLISPTAIEGLHQIGNSASVLRLYHRLGVRYATLTWNCHNKYADSALTSSATETKKATPYWHGLSPAGRDLVREMNRLGMLVDLSHVSSETMKDALVGDDGENSSTWSGSLAPPIFSHSSAYAVCPHPRNVPDEILQLVKRRNSLVMVNVFPGFISCTAGNSSMGLPDPFPANGTLAQVVRHIRHIGELIGYEHVGIGTDFDGIESAPRGLEDVSKFPDLVAELLRQGVSDDDAAKVVGRNLLRVWAEADDVAARLQATTLPLEDDLPPLKF